MKRFLPVAVLTFSAAILFCSCGKQSSPVEITERRDAPPPSEAKSIPPQGMGKSMPPNGMMNGATPSAQTSDAQKKFTWSVPEGWSEVPPTPMRVGNFRMGPQGEAECYLAVLDGAGGGALMNINRWRSQMGAGEDSFKDEDVAKLPKISMLGKDAPLVETAGAYQGMMGDAKPGFLLIGTVCELDGQSVFVKMIGPEGVVKEQRDKFIAFCGSLH